MSNIVPPVSTLTHEPRVHERNVPPNAFHEAPPAKEGLGEVALRKTFLEGKMFPGLNDSTPRRDDLQFADATLQICFWKEGEFCGCGCASTNIHPV